MDSTPSISTPMVSSVTTVSQALEEDRCDRDVTDIVTRLRMQDADYALQEEAADEIERLRAEVSALHQVAKLLLREEARRG